MLTVVLSLEKEAYPENSHIFHCHTKLASFLIFYAFRFYLRTLAIILFSIFFASSLIIEKKILLTGLCQNRSDLVDLWKLQDKKEVLKLPLEKRSVESDFSSEGKPASTKMRYPHSEFSEFQTFGDLNRIVPCVCVCVCVCVSVCVCELSLIHI